MDFLKHSPYNSSSSENLVALLNEAFGKDISELRKQAASFLRYANTSDYKIFSKDYIYELSYSIPYRNFIVSKRVKAPAPSNTEVSYVPVDFMIHYCLVKGFAIPSQDIETWQNGTKGAFLGILKDLSESAISWHRSINKVITAKEMRRQEDGEYKLSNKVKLDEDTVLSYSHSNRGILITRRMRHSSRNHKINLIEEQIYFNNLFFPDSVINQITA